MTPSARLQAVIEILDELERTNAPADRFIREWFRARRYAGVKDRAAAAERVFAILRHRSFLAWRMQSVEPRALVMASVLAETSDIAEIEILFSGGGYGPSPLTAEERAALLAPPKGMPPLAVQGEFPAWLEPELCASLGEHLLDEMRTLCERASIDLRVNTLKTSREDVLGELARAGFAATPTPYAPAGLRLPPGEKLSALSKTAAFEQGRFEFQDEAAQIASLLVAAKPGERILDLAAGAGGKSLALAAAMKNEGEIVACDVDAARLQQLGPRAARAGASIARMLLIEDQPPQGPFDAVLVDAPCSGTGTWRRQPELKWRLTSEKLIALNALQDTLLDRAAARGRGRIVYATCSLLNCENEDRVHAFLARHPAFRIRPAADAWQAATSRPPPPGMGEFFKASPRRTQTDGFFAAIFQRAE